MNSAELEILRKGVRAIIADKLVDKFAALEIETEYVRELHATIFYCVGKALGETLDSIEVPINWRRFIKTKRCPEYLKEIVIYNINAYYPKLSLPQEKSYITIDR